MAREVHQREDLLRDAKAMTSRIELKIETGGQTKAVFAGFRPNGALSLYFDTEPVYQFNSLNQLRRAFVENRIIKAESGRFSAMKRQQSQTSSELLRHDLTEAEQNVFWQSMKERLVELKKALLEKRFRIVGQVPEGGDVLSQLQQWLENIDEVTIADSPGVA